MKWSAEAKVGLVTIIGVLLFTYVVITLAHAEIFGKPGFEIYTRFQDANGLQKGNSVRYVGVHVGKVESVTPSREGVDIKMKLDKGTEIPRDSKISITTDGLLGEKILAIVPGTDREHLLNDGDRIESSQGKSMTDMMDSASQLVGNANAMVQNINAVVGDADTQNAMRRSIQNVESMTDKTNGMLDANAANIQQITANMASMTSQMNTSLQRIDGDGATSDNVRNMAANMKNITDRFDNIARSLEKVTTDQQSQNDIQTTLHNTAQITDKVNKILGGESKIKVQGEAGLLYNDTKNESGANVNFRVYRNNTFALIGAENIGNGTNFNLQYGRHGDVFDSRFGLINGELGAGMDFFVDGPFRLSLEGYDPDNWRYRIKAQYRIHPDVYLFGQFTRPMERHDGGNYYGVNYAF
ncbi:virulence factor Mce [Megasphaera cerevisiae DSM 20462]|jgi:phospholipid/cholesterol/gamma-HCH transport system substrate-binding protein|uniref:Virulence factor Mce n=1 Tax=Megasphaera cerevisiae DSM 20462 TaxID=1122219 RepID=A0A0J6WWV3_9FIRM|nr:MlaD family protein [Megasphaera cerevisiae]KMO86698.1 virulence factor Mce [Megasphaera cerevisiae DSM 20462]MCI1750598.1 MCE family protein [Megasphaera cerevisiae]OKY53295.1 virulence factor Mce [Megasphaera cerevisiae]SJZ86478.1 phospholipid/cholesterol/gamma-HCH transport system substrate-binding protein [Megasphaera cerevisiae DSM 20462]